MSLYSLPILVLVRAMSTEAHNVLQIDGIVIDAWTECVVACQLQTDQRVFRVRPIHHDGIAVRIPTALDLRVAQHIRVGREAIGIRAIKDAVIPVTDAPLRNELVNTLGV